MGITFPFRTFDPKIKMVPIRICHAMSPQGSFLQQHSTFIYVVPWTMSKFRYSPGGENSQNNLLFFTVVR